MTAGSGLEFEVWHIMHICGAAAGAGLYFE